MDMNWSGISEKVIIGILSAVALGVLTLGWNWVSSGGVIRTLGGVTRAELDQHSASGLPTGVIVALDDPTGCPKLGVGWQDAKFVGQVLVGAGDDASRWAYRKAGGKPAITIEPANIPPLFVGQRTALSGNGVTVGLVDALSFTKPNSNNVVQTASAAAQPIDIMPPFVPVYFCKHVS
jgi:hypothetical protein